MNGQPVYDQNVPSWYHSSVQLGHKNDATSLQNLKNATTYFDAYASIRNVNNLSMPKVGLTSMAAAELNVDYSTNLLNNRGDLQHSMQYGTLEDLATGGGAYNGGSSYSAWPYSGWYLQEKDVFDRLAAADTSGAFERTRYNFGMNESWENLANDPRYNPQSEVVGHYVNLVYENTGSFGFGVTPSAVTFDEVTEDGDYTVSEFKNLVNEYIEHVPDAHLDDPDSGSHDQDSHDHDSDSHDSHDSDSHDSDSHDSDSHDSDAHEHDSTPYDEDHPFPDVKDPSSYFYKPVYSMNSKKVMRGYSDGSGFGPYNHLKRYEAAVLIHNLAVHNGDDTLEQYPEDSHTFSDTSGLSESDLEAVEWATNNEIVKGYGDTGRFDPFADIKREDFILMLSRYLMSTGQMVFYQEESADSYYDANQIDSWARDAILWGITFEMIGQNTGNLLKPRNPINRGEVATILYRSTLVE